MLDSNAIIVLVIILVILYLKKSSEAFSCISHNNKQVLNYNRCYNDPDNCTVMVGISGNSFCTPR